MGRTAFSAAPGRDNRPSLDSSTALLTARDVTYFLLHGGIAVQHFMALGIGFVVTDIAVNPRQRSGVDQAHPVEPIRERPPGVFNAGDIPVDHQPVGPASQVLGIMWNFSSFLDVEKLQLGTDQPLPL